MSLLFAHRWDCFSCRPGFVGNETCSAATTNGSMNVTVAVTPGSCDNNMCGLQHQAGSCSSGRCNCPKGSQMTPGFACNPNETALALVPLVPVCRYPFFTPSGALSWSGMTVKSGTTLDITFTLEQLGAASQCAAPDAALLPNIALLRSTCGKRASATPASAQQQMGVETAECKNGEYSAQFKVPNGTRGACMQLVIKLADGSVKRATVKVVYQLSKLGFVLQHVISEGDGLLLVSAGCCSTPL